MAMFEETIKLEVVSVSVLPILDNFSDVKTKISQPVDLNTSYSRLLDDDVELIESGADSSRSKCKAKRKNKHELIHSGLNSSRILRNLILLSIALFTALLCCFGSSFVMYRRSTSIKEKDILRQSTFYCTFKHSINITVIDPVISTPHRYPHSQLGALQLHHTSHRVQSINGKKWNELRIPEGAAPNPSPLLNEEMMNETWVPFHSCSPKY